MRSWMSEGTGYQQGIPLGEVMRGGGIARVLESRARGFCRRRSGAGAAGLADPSDHSPAATCRSSISRLAPSRTGSVRSVSARSPPISACATSADCDRTIACWSRPPPAGWVRSRCRSPASKAAVWRGSRAGRRNARLSRASSALTRRSTTRRRRTCRPPSPAPARRAWISISTMSAARRWTRPWRICARARAWYCAAASRRRMLPNLMVCAISAGWRRRMGACRVSSCSTTTNATTRPAPGSRRGDGTAACGRGCICWKGWRRRPSDSACCSGARTRASWSCASPRVQTDDTGGNDAM